MSKMVMILCLGLGSLLISQTAAAQASCYTECDQEHAQCTASCSNGDSACLWNCHNAHQSCTSACGGGGGGGCAQCMLSCEQQGEGCLAECYTLPQGPARARCKSACIRQTNLCENRCFDNQC
jgi:hypothetical protein